MGGLILHDFHQRLGGRFLTLNGMEAVADYGDIAAEHRALCDTAGVLDLSFRGRLCLTGTDRLRFLHGQVTNDIQRLAQGEGCYAALTSGKGKLQSDLNVYRLPEEVLLDFEPGLTATVSQRLEKYLVADDVQVVDVAGLYGLLSIQGPAAEDAIRGLGVSANIPAKAFTFASYTESTLGEVYVMNQPRLGTAGFDLYVPAGGLSEAAGKLQGQAHLAGGRFCGWQAFETARIEAGIPRFGADMDETNLPQECGIEARAVSYTKGCYIGQEILNRIHTLGHVNRQLVTLRLADSLSALPQKGDKLTQGGKEIGYVTSVAVSPRLQAKVGLGYVRKEACTAGTEVVLRTAAGDRPASIVKQVS